MNFWDSSAILPLCVNERHSDTVRNILKNDPGIVVWWACVIECESAFARLSREGRLDHGGQVMTKKILSVLSGSWSEIGACEEIRDIALRLLRTHSLRIADSLQLAAALLWADRNPKGHRLVCFDARLRDAARKEGFVLLPEE